MNNEFRFAHSFYLGCLFCLSAQPWLLCTSVLGFRLALRVRVCIFCLASHCIRGWNCWLSVQHSAPWPDWHQSSQHCSSLPTSCLVISMQENLLVIKKFILVSLPLDLLESSVFSLQIHVPASNWNHCEQDFGESVVPTHGLRYCSRYLKND